MAECFFICFHISQHPCLLKTKWNKNGTSPTYLFFRYFMKILISTLFEFFDLSPMLCSYLIP